MTFLNRYSVALGRDDRSFCLYDLVTLDVAPDLQRLLLALLFFTADIRDHVPYHFRPILKCLAGTGDRLICTYIDVLDTEAQKRC